MKLPLSWLKEYISIALPPEEIAAILTMAGLEVDAIEAMPLPFRGIVVGKVLSVAKHPDAEKLVVATVSDGKEQFQVVCGAPNCRAGIKTAFAKIGATLQEKDGQTFTIKKGKLRGVESFGMLCSAKELGQSEDHEGIMELPEQLVEGSNLEDLYGDIIFEISLTPNLGHCANVLGVARELATATGLPLHPPSAKVKENSPSTTKEEISVRVENPTLCPRYAGRMIKGVTVGPSPEWMQKRLAACGMRSINNVVDVTNLVLLEIGQPLHAFDAALLRGNQIFVKQAREGEIFQTLDGVERILTPETLLICDKERPVALAGVMGGLNSEVSDKTTDVFLESAYFLPTNVRRTSKRLGLQTEGSKRFERGCDPNSVLYALDRAALLIQETAGGQICQGVIDIKAHVFTPIAIPCRLKRVNQILGTSLALGEVESIFRRLQFNVETDSDNTLSVHVPTYRADIHAEIDLIEEVARVYGYNNIDLPITRYQSSHIPHTPMFLFEREARSLLIAEGLQEFLSCNLINPSLGSLVSRETIPSESIVKLLNPSSTEQSILRPSLLPGLLQLVKHNLDRQTHDISGFEVGSIYFKSQDQYTEQSVLGILLTGKSRPHHWDDKPKDVDFFDLKGIVENLLSGLNSTEWHIEASSLKNFHPGRQASVIINGLKVGALGEIHPATLRQLDIPQRVLFAELDLHDLFPLKTTVKKVRDLSIYPSSERDWTITLPEEIPIENLFSAVRALSSRLLEDVFLLDIYRDASLGEGQKNVTLHFIYRDSKKTISFETVEAEHARLVQGTLSKIQNKTT